MFFRNVTSLPQHYIPDIFILIFCGVFIVCNLSFIVCVALCAVFYLSVVCYIVCYVNNCVLCLIAVPLSPGKISLVSQLNNNNNNNNKLLLLFRASVLVKSGLEN
jgi:hypothetical protein